MATLTLWISCVEIAFKQKEGHAQKGTDFAAPLERTTPSGETIDYLSDTSCGHLGDRGDSENCAASWLWLSSCQKLWPLWGNSSRALTAWGSVHRGPTAGSTQHLTSVSNLCGSSLGGPSLLKRPEGLLRDGERLCGVLCGKGRSTQAKGFKPGGVEHAPAAGSSNEPPA